MWRRESMYFGSQETLLQKEMNEPNTNIAFALWGGRGGLAYLFRLERGGAPSGEGQKSLTLRERNKYSVHSALTN